MTRWEIVNSAYAPKLNIQVEQPGLARARPGAIFCARSITHAPLQHLHFWQTSLPLVRHARSSVRAADFIAYAPMQKLYFRQLCSRAQATHAIRTAGPTAKHVFVFSMEKVALEGAVFVSSMMNS